MSARTAVRDALRATNGYLGRKTAWLNRPATWRTWVVGGLFLLGMIYLESWLINPGDRWLHFANVMVLGFFVIMPIAAVLLSAILMSITGLIGRFVGWLMK